MSHEAKVALDARSAQVDFFVCKTGGKSAYFVTGYSYPWNKKDGLKNGNYIPLTLQPGEELAIFQRITNNNPGLPKEFKIGFVSTEKATQMELAQYDSIFSKQLYSGKFYLGAIYFGIILFTALFNFFFFLTVRERSTCISLCSFYACFWQQPVVQWSLFKRAPVIDCIYQRGCASFYLLLIPIYTALFSNISSYAEMG